jgi:hypothetical protein
MAPGAFNLPEGFNGLPLASGGLTPRVPGRPMA